MIINNWYFLTAFLEAIAVPILVGMLKIAIYVILHICIFYKVRTSTQDFHYILKIINIIYFTIQYIYIKTDL